MVHVVHPRVWPAVLSAVSVTPPRVTVITHSFQGRKRLCSRSPIAERRQRNRRVADLLRETHVVLSSKPINDNLVFYRQYPGKLELCVLYCPSLFQGRSVYSHSIFVGGVYSTLFPQMDAWPR
jgi:hypothetical protein